MSKPAESWLGLDVGTRRIGIALSNALGIAQPLLTLERIQPRRDQRSVLRLARRHSCAGIVIGNPLHLSGDRSRQTERVHTFVDQLKALLASQQESSAERPADPAAAPVSSLEIHLWDERLSTAEAHATLDATGRNRNHRRPIIDQLAAALILQGWLDARNGVLPLLPPDL